MKKGQVTIFVILGLIVFILAFIAFFFIFQVDPDLDVEDEFSEDVDAQLQPLVNSVNHCIADLGREVLEDLGRSGGFSDASNVMYGYEPAYLNTGLEIFEGSDRVLPFWLYFDGSPRDEGSSYVFNVPPLSGGRGSIAYQVGNYVEQNILECVNNFEDYEDFEVIPAEPSADVRFRDDDVFIGLNYPLSIVFPSGLDSSISRFSNTVDVRFRDVYELASQIALQTQFLDEEPFLEKSTRLILSILSMGGKDADIPPISPDVEMGPSFRFWSISSVEEELKQTLQETVPYFQIRGSRDSYVPMTQNPYLDGIYSQFQFPLELVEPEVLESTKVRFNFFSSWPMFLDILPSSGDMVGPVRDAGSSVDMPLIGEVGVTRYEYAYDLVYPILITLEESDSFGGDGFFFQFPVTVNLVNNEPRVSLLDDFPEFDFDEDDVFESGFGAVDQRTVPVRINLFDAYTSDPVYDLSVQYSCGSESIYLEVLDEDEVYVETYVPPCIGGTLSINDYSYFASPVTKDFIVDDGVVEVDFEVYPEREVEVSVGTLRFSPQLGLYPLPDEPDFSREWSVALSESTHLPYDDESVVVIFSRVQEPGDSEFFRVVDFEAPHESDVVGFVPGRYNVQVVSSLDLDEPWVIENQTYEVGPDGFISGLFVDDEEVFLEKIVFNESLVLGFMELRDEFTFNISKDDLLSVDYFDVVYPSYDYQELLLHQDLEVFDLVNNASKRYPQTFTVSKS